MYTRANPGIYLKFNISADVYESGKMSSIVNLASVSERSSRIELMNYLCIKTPSNPSTINVIIPETFMNPQNLWSIKTSLKGET